MQESTTPNSNPTAQPSRKRTVSLMLCTGIVAICAGAAGMFAVQHWGNLQFAFLNRNAASVPDAKANDEHDHSSESPTSLRLSPQARKNIGLTLITIQQTSYEQTVTMPAIVVDRPGKTKIQVVAPLSGVVTRTSVNQGEALKPGQRLFDLRLMHEELVQAQSGFLRTAGELDVVEKEIARLKPASERGVVAGKTLLERQYEKSKLLAIHRAQRQSLLLHGLSNHDVDAILEKRELKPGLTVFAPGGNGISTTSAKTTDTRAGVEPANFEQEEADQQASTRPPWILQELTVQTGQHVDAGDRLCVLADYSQLYIEGMAFEQDLEFLHRAIQNDWQITAVRQRQDESVERTDGLKILFLAGEIDPESRALRFYVELPNRRIEPENKPADDRFIQWQFKPGQRLSLEIPIDHWPDSIVVPVEAVIREGVESYVFQQNGTAFERREVHERHRDRNFVVIEADGSLFDGDVIAVSGAYQMHLALKNQAGGGVDPHAGHTH